MSCSTTGSDQKCFDNDPLISLVHCPKCVNNARRHDFEGLQSGCGNHRHYNAINCLHCGHHSCNQEYCSKCNR